MTEALRYIQAELRRGHSQFLVPARILQMDDRPLWRRGALVFRGAYLSKVRCPECGKLVEVDRVVDETGDPRYSVLCIDCDALEVRPIPPEAVELLEFRIRAFKIYVDDPLASGEYVEDAASCLISGRDYEPSVGQNAQPNYEEQSNEIQRLAKQVGRNTAAMNKLSGVVSGLSSRFYGDFQAPNKRSKKNEKVVELAIQEYWKLVNAGKKPRNATTDACRTVESAKGIGDYSSFESFRDAVKTELDSNAHSLSENLDCN